ncbi:MAG: hypothetical protein GX130_00280, partial [Candidatus Hydrogenedens sp.]|nr:hypothetical protein [Candidatus Hydrogenedens sp.]
MSKKLLTPALLCLLLSGIMISAVAEESVVLVLAGEVDVDLCFEEDIYEEAGIAELWVGEFDVWADTPNSAVQITIAHFGDADAVYSLDTIAAAMNDAMAMYGIDTYEIVYDYDGGTASAMRTVNVIQCGDLAEGEDLVDPEEGEDLVDPEEGEDAVDPEEGEGAVDPEEGEGAVDPEEGEGAVDP